MKNPNDTATAFREALCFIIETDEDQTIESHIETTASITACLFMRHPEFMYELFKETGLAEPGPEVDELLNKLFAMLEEISNGD